MICYCCYYYLYKSAANVRFWDFILVVFIILLILMRDFKMLIIKCDSIYNVSVNIKSWNINNAAITVIAYIVIMLISSIVLLIKCNNIIYYYYCC